MIARQTWFDAASMTSVFLLPYLFGLVVCLHALARRHTSRRAAGIAVAGVLVAAVAMAAGRAAWDVAHTQNREITPVLVAGSAVSILYLARTAARRTAIILCLRWYGALVCVLWFGVCWSLLNETRIGLWISFFGSVAIFAGCLSEARARAGLDVRRALAALAAASVGGTRRP